MARHSRVSYAYLVSTVLVNFDDKGTKDSEGIFNTTTPDTASRQMREVANWPLQNWQHVMWANESPFQLFQADGKSMNVTKTA